MKKRIFSGGHYPSDENYEWPAFYSPEGLLERLRGIFGDVDLISQQTHNDPARYHLTDHSGVILEFGDFATGDDILSINAGERSRFVNVIGPKEKVGEVEKILLGASGE